MTLQTFAENLPLLLTNAFSGWLLSVTFFYHGVRIKPFMCAKCMAFWLTLLYLSYHKYLGSEMEYYYIITMSLTSAVFAIVFEKYIIKR